MTSKLQFYGTGAAEAIPCPFCSCPVCENARARRGREIRRRSMFRLSGDVCIDLGPDAVAQAAEFGDLTELRHILVTHTHEDHFYTGMPNVRAMAAGRGDFPLSYYLADKAFEIVEAMKNDPVLMKGLLGKMISDGVVDFHRLEFGQAYQIAGFTVTPLRGNHFGNMGEYAANYLITLPDGRTLFYGLDTGYYLEETFRALAGRRLDLLVSECTFGNAERGERPDSHLDLGSCLAVFRRLWDEQVIDRDSRVFLSHINHKHTATHADLERAVARWGFSCPVTVAFDGLCVD